LVCWTVRNGNARDGDVIRQRLSCACNTFVTGAQLASRCADLVIPTGQLFSGSDTIRAFYQSAFDSGYADSSAEAAILQARLVTTGVCILDGTWRISRAHHGQASEADESGVFSALLVYRQGIWKISALREQSSAQKLEIIRSGR
jgi:hypothetical protein